MNEFLQNPHFKRNKINEQASKRWKIVNRTGSIKQSGWENFEKLLMNRVDLVCSGWKKKLQNSLAILFS